MAPDWVGCNGLSELPLVSEGDSSVPESEQPQEVRGDNGSSLWVQLPHDVQGCVAQSIG